MNDFLLSILSTSLIANAAMLWIIISNIKDSREKEIRLHLYEAEVWRYRSSKKYRKVVRFLDPHGMPQNRLDEVIKGYQNDGWTFDGENCVNGLLTFYKNEEIKED